MDKQLSDALEEAGVANPALVAADIELILEVLGEHVDRKDLATILICLLQRAQTYGENSEMGQERPPLDTRMSMRHI